jgi:colicin import membrane protein
MAVAVQPTWLKAHWPYLLGAVLLHAVVAGVFGLTMIQLRRDVPPPTLAIQATVVDVTQIPKSSRQAQQERERERREAEAREAAERKRQEEEAAKREQEAQAEQQKQETQKRQEQEREQERVREEQLVREREAQEKIVKEKAAEEQRAVERKQQADAERQKKAEAERQQKAEAERKRVAEIERKQRERAAAEAEAREKQLRDQLAEEEGLMQARSSPAMSQYAAQIQQHVERQWNRPASARSGLECVVAVSQSPNGTVLRVQVEQCNGDAAVKQSIENAVQKASPLPLPSDMRLFERNLRFIFKPAD